MESGKAGRYSLFAIRSLWLHAQRERGAVGVTAGGGFDVGVLGDGDGAAGAGHRDEPLARAAGEIAIAGLAAGALVQSMQAARAHGAGRTGRSHRAGIAFGALRSCGPNFALRSSRTLRAFEAA